MLYLKTSMILTDDKSESIPSDLEIPSFIIKGRNKEELLNRLAYHLELCHAVLQSDGVDGVDYHSIARKSVNKFLIKKKYE